MKRPILAIATLALVAGCATTPENRYYTLSAEPGAASAHDRRVTVAKVRLPGMMDRSQLVVRTGPQTVDIREFDRWAEPLDQLVPRILAQDLASRTSRPNLALPERHLFVAIDEFSADDAGAVLLVGRWWTLEPGEDAVQRQERPFALSRQTEAGAKDGAHIAATMSILLGMLADDIGR